MNYGIQKVWTQKRNTFLQLQGRRQGIMLSEVFLLLVSLIYFLFSPKKKEYIEEKTGLVKAKTKEIFEYEKNNNEY